MRRDWRSNRITTCLIAVNSDVQRQAKGEDGFSLIELVIVMIIIPVIIGGVTAAILASVTNDTTIYNRISDSADAQLASADFARDVQSASQLTTSPAGACANSNTPTLPFADGILSINSPIIKSTAQANFTPTDVGMTVTDLDGDIPVYPPTTITSVQSLTQATMSAPATGSATSDHVTMRQGTALLTLQWTQTISRTVTDGILQSNGTLQSATAQFVPSGVNSDVNSIVSDPTAIGGKGILVSTTIKSYVSPTEVDISGSDGTATGDHVIISRNIGSTVTYWSDPVQLNGTRSYDLVREYCKSSPTSIFKATGAILAHDLAANQSPATVTCGPSIPSTTCTPTYLSQNVLSLLSSASNPNPSDGVTSVSLSVTEPLSRYQFNLLATPRYSDPEAGGSPLPTLLLLGTGTNVLTENDAAFNVTGQIGFNSFNSADVDLNASATLSDSNPQSLTNPFAVYQCAAGCGVINPAASYTGTAPATTTSLFPTPSVPAPQGLSASGSPGTCTVPQPWSKGTTVSCTPGVYSSAITLGAKNIVLTFQPGNYLFEGPIDETSTGDSIVFGSGVYAFNPSGLTALSVSSTSDNLTGNGVAFYVESGQVNIAGTKNSIQISPATAGPYAGIVLYQVPADTDQLQLAASTNSIDGLSGAVETPGAAVAITANSHAINLGFIVAQTLAVTSASSLGVVNASGS
jgi:prepilin-type N-terminal cleavage/methylation domain-containing protein